MVRNGGGGEERENWQLEGPNSKKTPTSSQVPVAFASFGSVGFVTFLCSLLPTNLNLIPLSFPFSSFVIVYTVLVLFLLFLFSPPFMWKTTHS